MRDVVGAEIARLRGELEQKDAEIAELNKELDGIPGQNSGAV